MSSPSSRNIAAGLLVQVRHLPIQEQKKALVLLMRFAQLVEDHAKLRGDKPSVWAEHFIEVLEGYFERLRAIEASQKEATNP